MRNRITGYTPLNADLAILLFRLILGGIFVYHGYTKVLAYNTIAPHFPDLIGIGGKTSFLLVIFAELICGFLIAIGLLTRLAVIPILITMIVAFFMAHAKDAFAMKEIPFIYLLMCLPIFIAGSGRYSVDRMIQGRRHRHSM